MLYRAVVRRKARGVFSSLSKGDWRPTMRDMSEDVHHFFPSGGALGGERHSREAFERWFERLYRLIPEIEFEVHDVAVRGWPWDTAVAIEWTDRGRAADGAPYENEGAHWIRLRWGRATEVHAYLDTETLNAVMERLAEAGIEEASMPPVT